MKGNHHLAPYLGKSIEPVFGLNHLGLRNSAENLFTTLLPGLNGVTERVRYYSFYCWLTGKFRDEFTGDERTAAEFRSFVRKSEILLALTQARLSDNIQGIPGITYARDTLNLGYTSIDLYKCIYNENEMRHTDRTYWANPGGILRQYYNSSMKDLALLPNLDGFPSVSVPSEQEDLPDDTICGRTLGDSFAKSIGADNEKLFLDCVKKARVSIAELDILKETFIMKDFGDIGEERELLIQTFNQQDYPASEKYERTLRKETIRHFLMYCQNGRTENKKDPVAFPELMYEKVLADELGDDCALGWYAYHVNDEWQLNASTVFSCVLKLLSDDGGWVSIKDLSESFADRIVAMLFSDNKSISIGSVCELIDARQVPELSGKSIDVNCAQAFINILSAYCRNRKRKDIIEKYRKVFSEFQRGDFFSYMEELDGMLSVSLRDFLSSFILEKVIYRHHTVSLLKYCQTGVSSNKILIEDGYAMFLGQTEVSHTAPRIESLINFLTDLGLIDHMVPTEDAVERYNLATI